MWSLRRSTKKKRGKKREEKLENLCMGKRALLYLVSKRKILVNYLSIYYVIIAFCEIGRKVKNSPKYPLYLFHTEYITYRQDIIRAVP